ncbi:MAG: hypothetical protein MUE85_00440 [Microscillaceae bacterium]|jgi:hypothetical protein|nr:hypothetical protein [Microscillaceae bacterium]
MISSVAFASEKSSSQEVAEIKGFDLEMPIKSSVSDLNTLINNDSDAQEFYEDDSKDGGECIEWVETTVEIRLLIFTIKRTKKKCTKYLVIE